MIWLLSTTALASDDQALPDTHHLVAVFAGEPTAKARTKAVRYAMRKSRDLQGGQDWGRALCFRFEGPADAELIRAAVAKTGVPAEVRPADDCLVPPPEALVPVDAEVSIAVHLTEVTPPAAIRNALTNQLGIGGLGLVGVRTLDLPSDKFCMEFNEQPAPSVLDFMLQALPFDVVTTEQVARCMDAFVPPK